MTTASSREIWIEGDQLLYTQGNLANQIFSVPLAGGPAQLLVDGAAGRTNADVAYVHASSPTDFFWAEWSCYRDHQAPTTIWRTHRDTGETVLLGSATARLHSGHVVSYESMAVTSDGILLQAILGIAAVVPFDGSPVRSLAAPRTKFRGFRHFSRGRRRGGRILVCSAVRQR